MAKSRSAESLPPVRRVKRTSQIDRHIGAKLRTLRRARGMTQAELGSRLGVSHTQVRKYERGADRIGAARLLEIARLFGVAAAAFFDGLA